MATLESNLITQFNYEESLLIKLELIEWIFTKLQFEEWQLRDGYRNVDGINAIYRDISPVNGQNGAINLNNSRKRNGDFPLLIALRGWGINGSPPPGRMFRLVPSSSSTSSSSAVIFVANSSAAQ